jgi:hypothetical protein
MKRGAEQYGRNATGATVLDRLLPEKLVLQLAAFCARASMSYYWFQMEGFREAVLPEGGSSVGMLCPAEG